MSVLGRLPTSLRARLGLGAALIGCVALLAAGLMLYAMGAVSARIDAALAPLTETHVPRGPDQPPLTESMPLSGWAERTGRAVEAIAADEAGDLAALWSGEAGERLAYRKLHHPHVNEQPFTRSLHDVLVPDGTRVVYIRAWCSQGHETTEPFPLELKRY